MTDDVYRFCGNTKIDLKIIPPRKKPGKSISIGRIPIRLFCRVRNARPACTRVSEVADVWYVSGAMPFAQVHCPGSPKKEAHKANRWHIRRLYCRGDGSAGGWFYTLLAIATAMGYPAPYRNVVSLGLINDKFGQKMSKSKGTPLIRGR